MLMLFSLPESGARVRVSNGIVSSNFRFLSLVDPIPTGYAGSRKTRCTDRFVRYPYPKALFSNYRQNFYGKLRDTTVKCHKDAFNLEKEAKIINPHRMDLSTTNKVTFTKKKGLGDMPKHKETAKVPKPIQMTSSYAAAYPDWDNGKNDIFHEKHPQFPYYSLPFQGESSYAKVHNDRPAKDLSAMKKRAEDAQGTPIK